MGQRKYFSGIGERDGSFSRGIKGCQFCVSRVYFTEEKRDFIPANRNTKSAIRGTLALLLPSM